jgi:hypothetical protein
MRGHVRTLALWTECLWPGLPQLWRHGSWSALALAIGFSIGLNLALLSTLVWTELTTAGAKSVLWATLGVFWLVSTSLAVRNMRQRAADATADYGRDLFPDVLGEYLRGNWFQVEALCHELLDRDDHDAEAHLMLATVYRQTRRWDEAEEKLRHLATLTTAGKWAWEIYDEGARLAEARQAGVGSEVNVPAETELRGAA